MISDNSISRSATQLALQLMIEFIVILRPTQACLSSGCCPPTSQLIQKSQPQQCQPTASSCPGSNPSYAPQTPYGIGGSGSFYQPPIAYVSSGNAPPSPPYENGGLYQSPSNIHPNVDSSYSNGDKETDIGYGGDREMLHLTPPPINIPLPPQQSLGEESGYDQKIMETKMKLAPLSTEMLPGKPDSIPELYKQPENMDDVYTKIVADHVGQQQKQQSYTEISTAEKSHAKTDVIDYGSGAVPHISGIQPPQVKLEQPAPAPDAAYGGGAVPHTSGIQPPQVKLEQPAPDAAYGGGAVPLISKTQSPQVKLEQPAPAPDAAYGGGAVPLISKTQSPQVKLEQPAPAPDAAYGGGAVPLISKTQSPQVKLEQPAPEAAYGGGPVPLFSETQSSQAKSEQPGPEAAYGGGEGDTSIQKSKIGTAPATSESSKAEIKYDGQEGNGVVESRSVEMDDSTCNDPMLKAIIELTLNENRDNLDAARKIESKASERFGGRFNSIVSDSEFAYVNWYGKRNCQLQINGRHSLTWED